MNRSDTSKFLEVEREELTPCIPHEITGLSFLGMGSGALLNISSQMS